MDAIEAYEEDAEDYIEDEVVEDFTDGLTRGQRARQVAANFVAQANWPSSVLPLVAQIFISSGWGATRVALERELNNGLTPEELELAAHVKAVWQENDLYWMAFTRDGSTALSYSVISWPVVLMFIRTFDLIPDIEEIEYVLDEMFYRWYEDHALRRRVRSFSRYLYYRFSEDRGRLSPREVFEFYKGDEFAWDECSDSGYYDICDVQKNKVLDSYGLLRLLPLDYTHTYFSDKSFDHKFS